MAHVRRPILNQRFFFSLESRGSKGCIQWCMQSGLLSHEKICPSCGNFMELKDRKDRSDNCSWVCRKKGEGAHYVKRSVRYGSWFENSRLNIGTILLLTAMWAKGATHAFIMEDLQLSSHTVTDWMSFCREVCVWSLLDSCEMVGGPGITVEIDESKFGKRKFNRGRLVVGAWVFGVVERGSKRCFMRVVPDRGAQTLLSVIKDWVLPGTTIISDCWRAYDCLEDEGYVHLKVNHSLNFLDPQTGAHTNSVEGTWSACKRALKGRKKVKNGLDSYLAEYIWRRTHQTPYKVEEFLKAIQTVYPPV